MLDSMRLDPEEQEIVEAFDKDELTPIQNMEQELKLHQAYAAETFKKDK